MYQYLDQNGKRIHQDDLLLYTKRDENSGETTKITRQDCELGINYRLKDSVFVKDAEEIAESSKTIKLSNVAIVTHSFGRLPYRQMVKQYANLDMTLVGDCIPVKPNELTDYQLAYLRANNYHLSLFYKQEFSYPWHFS